MFVASWTWYRLSSRGMNQPELVHILYSFFIVGIALAHHVTSNVFRLKCFGRFQAVPWTLLFGPFSLVFASPFIGVS